MCNAARLSWRDGTGQHNSGLGAGSNVKIHGMRVTQHHAVIIERTITTHILNLPLEHIFCRFDKIMMKLWQNHSEKLNLSSKQSPNLNSAHSKTPISTDNLSL